MIKNKSYRLIIALIVGFVFADPPNWDANGDGVLDNYKDYVLLQLWLVQMVVLVLVHLGI